MQHIASITQGALLLEVDTESQQEQLCKNILERSSRLEQGISGEQYMYHPQLALSVAMAVVPVLGTPVVQPLAKEKFIDTSMACNVYDLIQARLQEGFTLTELSETSMVLDRQWRPDIVIRYTLGLTNLTSKRAPRNLNKQGMKHPPRTIPMPSPELPWARLTTQDVLRVFNSEALDAHMDVLRFARLLKRLLWIESTEESNKLAALIFPFLDRDRNRVLTSRELGIGIAMLASNSKDDIVRAVFEIIDHNSSGRISQAEMERFLQIVAPTHTSRTELHRVLQSVMQEADTNKSGAISYEEVSHWFVITALMRVAVLAVAQER